MIGHVILLKITADQEQGRRVMYARTCKAHRFQSGRSAPKPMMTLRLCGVSSGVYHCLHTSIVEHDSCYGIMYSNLLTLYLFGLVANVLLGTTKCMHGHQ